MLQKTPKLFETQEGKELVSKFIVTSQRKTSSEDIAGKHQKVHVLLIVLLELLEIYCKNPYSSKVMMVV